MKHTLSIAAVCVALTLVTASCNSSSISGQSSSGTTNSAATSTTAATTKTTLNLNPLTGISDIAPSTSTRPVCVMIGNNDRSRPQYGLDKADMYMEAETEGGITRIMAVFSGMTRVPDKLGPVRSARTPFILIAESLGSVYCHAGASKAGQEILNNADLTNVDSLRYVEGKAFWRDEALRQSRGYEYSMMTSGTNLTDLAASQKYSLEMKKSAPFTFGSMPTGTGAGNKVQIRMSGSQTIGFIYNSQSKLYSKINGTLSEGQPHVTADGVQLTATNILILYDEKYNENETTISFPLKNGIGTLVTGGVSRSIKWSRTADSLQFTEENGSPMNVSAGKTYVCLTDNANASKTILE